MPTIRFFKIGVNFDMVKRRSDAYNYNPDAGQPNGSGANSAANGQSRVPASDWNQAQEITEWDKQVIREAQEDLPLVSRPFDEMAQRLGLTVPELFAQLSEYQERKLMRRFQRGAVPPPFRFPGQRDDCLEGSAGALRRGGDDYGGELGGHPLLRAANLPRLAIQPLHHGACPYQRRVRRNRPEHRAGHRHH